MNNKLNSSLLCAFLIFLSGCAGSPAMMAIQSEEGFYNSNISGRTLEYLCDDLREHMNDDRQFKQSFQGWWKKSKSLIERGISEHGAVAGDCSNLKAFRFKQQNTIKQYNIDGLLIEKISKNTPPQECFKGTNHTLSLRGTIGPDSSFAIDKILQDLTPCTNQLNEIASRIQVKLESDGGLLQDGYKLGKVLKKFNVHSVIEDGKLCASSCAVSFLGGKERTIQDGGSILFHSPYHKTKGADGKPQINCDVEESVLDELKEYYIEMTSNAEGELLFERTMWYCSSNDGWVITGSGAATLFGIATN